MKAIRAVVTVVVVGGLLVWGALEIDSGHGWAAAWLIGLSLMLGAPWLVHHTSKRFGGTALALEHPYLQKAVSVFGLTCFLGVFAVLLMTGYGPAQNVDRGVWLLICVPFGLWISIGYWRRWKRGA